eukprot:TRINITY_DN12649_c0_g1_i1.p1 TRINITY_DN12649_c0_g1~~TRINITY_DN12649_c0_g1_i1.p1  ORF type:complete len:835 (+),score=276.17 TRINITY_DN12649_c0_g1_i1:103-2505(+)
MGRSSATVALGAVAALRRAGPGSAAELRQCELLAETLSAEDADQVADTAAAVCSAGGAELLLERAKRRGDAVLPAVAAVEQLAYSESSRCRLAASPAPARLVELLRDRVADAGCAEELRALLRLCGNLAIDPPAAARLCVLGCIPALVELAAAAGEEDPVTVDTAAFALDAFGTSADRYAYIGRCAELTGGFLGTLCSCAAAAGGEARADEGEEEEEKEEKQETEEEHEEVEEGEEEGGATGERALGLLRALVLGGHVQPVALLGTAPVAAVLRLGRKAPPESDAAHLCKVLLWAWTAEAEGVAVMAAPPAALRHDAACTAALLAPVSRRCAELAAEAAEELAASITASRSAAGGCAAVAADHLYSALPPALRGSVAGAAAREEEPRARPSKRRRADAEPSPEQSRRPRLPLGRLAAARLAGSVGPADSGALAAALRRAALALAEGPQNRSDPRWWDVRLEPGSTQPYFACRGEEGYALASARRGRAEEIFRQGSSCGQGLVRVTRHGPWLRLRFDDSEQGLAWAGWAGTPGWREGRADPEVLGYDYIRSMAAATVGFLPNRKQPLQVCCIGLGSAALPAWVAHHFPSAALEVVERDSTVIAAAREAFGHTFVDAPPPGQDAPGRAGSPGAGSRAAGPWAVCEADAHAYLAAQPREGYDVLLVDAYGREGTVPEHLTSPEFLRLCGGALAPGGVCVAQLPNGPPQSAERALAGRYAQSLAAAVGGPVHFVRIDRQPSNVVLAACRPGSGSQRGKGAAARASALSRQLGLAFDAGELLSTVRPMCTGGAGDEDFVPPEMWG